MFFAKQLNSEQLPFKGYIPQLRFKKYNAKHRRRLLSYTFTSLRNGSIYIIEAFYYEKTELFIIKFYNKDMSGKNKYADLTNKGDVRNILMTNFNLLKMLSEEYPTASFCFMGERRFCRDAENGQLLVEDAENNIRYRVYKLFIQQQELQIFIYTKFIQKYKDSISGYLFLNKSNKLFPALSIYEDNIINMLGNEFPEISF